MAPKAKGTTHLSMGVWRGESTLGRPSIVMQGGTVKIKAPSRPQLTASSCSRVRPPGTIVIGIRRRAAGLPVRYVISGPGPSGPVPAASTSIDIPGSSAIKASTLPVDDNTGPEGRLDWRFLDVRRRTAARLVFEVQTTVERAMREFAYANGCTEMHTPKLMGTASESGAERTE